MASGQLSRAEALACSGCRHACHVMLYADTKAQLFGRIPIKHIILMQMRFDGLLGFPGGQKPSSCVLHQLETGLVNKIPKYLVLHLEQLLVPDPELVKPSEETLESGLSRELSEELGLALPISVEDHVDSCFAPASSSSSSRLITHFYAKKMDEEQIREVERAAASTATDHGQEVLGMIRVPLYTTKGGGGLASFLSHSFIGSARSQLVDAMLRFNLVAPGELHKALTNSLKTHVHTKQDLQAALALTEEWRK